MIKIEIIPDIHLRTYPYEKPFRIYKSFESYVIDSYGGLPSEGELRRVYDRLPYINDLYIEGSFSRVDELKREIKREMDTIFSKYHFSPSFPTKYDGLDMQCAMQAFLDKKVAHREISDYKIELRTEGTWAPILDVHIQPRRAAEIIRISTILKTP